MADFVGTPLSGNAPLTVNFTVQSTGSITSWSWVFGDGGTSTEQNPSNTYNSAGTAAVVVREAPEDFANGVRLMAKLTEGALYVCSRSDADIPKVESGNVKRATFEGPHPAGLAASVSV